MSDVERNRAAWEAHSEAYQARHGEQLDKAGGAAWGVWQISEEELDVLGAVEGRDVLELGCGAAQWSIALARRGARPVGLDVSARQLEHARAAMGAAGVELGLVEASADAVPLPDASFDIVFCDHGALTFVDPQLVVPEAARLLRPGGRLAFNAQSAWAEACWAPGAESPDVQLHHPYFDRRRVEEDGMVSWFLPYGEWIDLLARHGLAVERLVEPRPAADATSSYRDERARNWARSWPMETIWVARKG